MKTVGLIAEYNPFHNGHRYHIQKAKECTGADRVVVVMSGNYVQRGTPAILPKSLRAECALNEGADLVLELPVCYASASAERFALGAVSLLDRLGIVDCICFGSEIGEIAPLLSVARLLSDEPELFRALLKQELRSGKAFPRARQDAVCAYLKESSESFCNDPSIDAGNLLSSPNNILGIEYIKALRTLGSSMRPYTIRREGNDYHDTDSTRALSSAGAIRAHISELEKLHCCMPEYSHAVLSRSYNRVFPILSDDYSLLLRAKLLSETPKSLIEYMDMNEELANRICRKQAEFLSFEQFCDCLKTKELTRARISRALLHLLLDIRERDVRAYLENGIHFYIRPLGFNSRSTDLLSAIKKHSSLPMLARISDGMALPGLAKQMFEQDLYASNLYYAVTTDKFQTPFQDERTRPVVRL